MILKYHITCSHCFNRSRLGHHPVQVASWNWRTSGIGPKFCTAPPVADAGPVKKNKNEKTKWKGRQLRVTGHQASAVSWCIYGDNVPKQFISRKAGSELCFLLLEAHTDDTLSRSLACLATMEGILPCRQRPSVPPLAYLL